MNKQEIIDWLELEIEKHVICEKEVFSADLRQFIRNLQATLDFVKVSKTREELGSEAINSKIRDMVANGQLKQDEE